jgi:hypothetical protein
MEKSKLKSQKSKMLKGIDNNHPTTCIPAPDLSYGAGCAGMTLEMMVFMRL